MSGREVSGLGFFSRRGLSERELSMGKSCPGGTVRGKLSGGEFTGHQNII